MKVKTFVLSMDAMVGEDISYLYSKPNFSRIFAQCASVGRVCTIYPSITYPAHTSIMTGCRPGKHGVFNNGVFNPLNDSTDWHLFSEIIQVEDIFAAAKRAGCSTAAVYWPITGCNPNIDFLINEYFFPDPNETIDIAYSKLGANQETLLVVHENMHRYPSEYRNRVGKLELKHTYDDFIIGCTCSMIRRYQPDFLMAHNCFLDTLRHRYGVFNSYVTEGLDQMDIWLGEIVAAMENAGIYEQTNFVLISDHGQLDFTRRVKINLLLARGGFIDVSTEGKVTDWRAFAQSNGMSATIFLKNAEDQEVYQKLYSYLKTLVNQEVWGIQKVYTIAEATERYGLSGSFSFIVETDGYSAFSDAYTEPLINPVDDLTDYRLGVATHGYEPEKGPQPIFWGSGPSFLPGAFLEEAHVVDIAPTLAKMLGDAMPQSEGRCLTELLF